MRGVDYKLLLFAPVVGGGRFIAASLLPLIAQFGPLACCGWTRT